MPGTAISAAVPGRVRRWGRLLLRRERQVQRTQGHGEPEAGADGARLQGNVDSAERRASSFESAERAPVDRSAGRPLRIDHLWPVRLQGSHGLRPASHFAAGEPGAVSGLGWSPARHHRDVRWRTPSQHLDLGEENPARPWNWRPPFPVSKKSSPRPSRGRSRTITPTRCCPPSSAKAPWRSRRASTPAPAPGRSPAAHPARQKPALGGARSPGWRRPRSDLRNKDARRARERTGSPAFLDAPGLE